MHRGTGSIGIVLALFASSWTLAQDLPRPRVTIVVKSPAPAPPPTAKPAPAVAGQPALREPLGLPTSAVVQGPPVPQALDVFVLARSEAKKSPAALNGLHPLSASAAAAQCRAQCGEARYVCTAREAGDCGTVWGECVVRCSGVNYSRTPDLAAASKAPVPR